jgi:RND family efflux transporter MFP subunit
MMALRWRLNGCLKFQFENVNAFCYPFNILNEKDEQMFDIKFPRHSRRILCKGGLVVTVLLGLAVLGPVPPGGAAPPRGGGPPPSVRVAAVQVQQINPAREYVGRMEAVQAVDLRARVEGFLEQVAFQEGADVQAGDLLFVIEPAPYRARRNEAQARVAQAESAMTRAQQVLQRLQSVRAGGVSATDLEAAESNEQQAAARLQEARAFLEQAQLSLSYTTLRAPISGRIGRSVFSRGSLVGPTSEALARIVQIDPIRAVYSMSEADYMASRKPNAENGGDLKLTFVPQLRLPDGGMHAHTGRLDFIDNQVDPGTGTIAVRAAFDNPQGILLPGQYVSVLVSRSEYKSMPVIPQSAVLEDRQGRYVFVVDAQNKIHTRRIVTGGTAEGRWVVESGLRPGETIVVQGVQKVTPGQVVQPMTEDKLSRK